MLIWCIFINEHHPTSAGLAINEGKHPTAIIFSLFIILKIIRLSKSHFVKLITCGQGGGHDPQKGIM